MKRIVFIWLATHLDRILSILAGLALACTAVTALLLAWVATQINQALAHYHDWHPVVFGIALVMATTAMILVGGWWVEHKGLPRATPLLQRQKSRLEHLGENADQSARRRRAEAIQQQLRQAVQNAQDECGQPNPAATPGHHRRKI